jgi:uncharacterized protein
MAVDAWRKLVEIELFKQCPVDTMVMHSRYNPPRWLRNPHVQSILSSSQWRRTAGMRLLERTGAQTQTHVLDLEKARLQGFYSYVPDRASRGVVMLLHGWEGSVESGYMYHTAARMLRAGFSVFRLNFRDHGDTHHLNEELFHSNRLDEVVQAAKWVSEQFTGDNFLIAGYSLGGNFALRVALSAPSAGIPLKHAAAVCPAIEPSQVLDTLEKSLPLYHWYFMRKWRRSLIKKRALYPQQYDFGDDILARDMRGLTQWLVQQHTDKEHLQAYFDGYAIGRGRLAQLQVPVSVLAAADDPVIPYDSFAELNLPEHSYLEVSPFGGHCGFVEGLSLRGYSERWVCKRLLQAVKSVAV